MKTDKEYEKVNQKRIWTNCKFNLVQKEQKWKLETNKEVYDELQKMLR